MSLKLLKTGERVDLTKGTGINKIHVSLGWDIKNTSAVADFDLDVSAFVLTAGKLIGDDDVVFYNQPKHVSGAISHSGDDRTGAGNITKSNDKEIITIDLDKVPANKDRLAFVVTIFEAAKNRQNFGMVKNAFIRILDAEKNDTEVMRYDLSEDYSTATAVVAGEVYRKDGEWKFQAVGTGHPGGLEELLRNYGYTGQIIS